MTTLERLSKILVKNYKVQPERLTLNGSLEEVGIDSLGMTELFFFIEDEFKVQLPYDPVPLRTLGDAVSYIDGLLVAQHAKDAQPSAVVPPVPSDPPP
jgi:acyl carrier protein